MNKSIKEIWGDSTPHETSMFLDRGKDTLLLTVGDSWTWGGSMVPDSQEYRQNHIWGKHLSDHLNCDWINYAFKGGGNNYILHALEYFLSKLIKNYRPLLDEKKYNVFKGDSWCSYNDYLKNTNHDFIEELYDYYFAEIVDVINLDVDQILSTKEYKKIHIVFTLTETGRDFDDSLIETHNSADSMLRLEENLFYKKIDQINNNLDGETKIIIGRNFTVDYDSTKSTSLEKNWVQINFEQNALNNFDNHNLNLSGVLKTGAVSQIAFQGIQKLPGIIDKKEYLVNQVDYVESFWDWLRNNPLNFNQATCHGTEESHQLWADYLKQYVK